jgi:glycosyltransferase involved in cell wall biosynthesis
MRPRLLFLVTEDSYFCSHRLPVARAAHQAGYEVVVATHVSDLAERIRSEGFRLVPMRLGRETLSPIGELRALLEVRRLFNDERPDIIHNVALKPILYGSIAALGQRKVPMVNAVAGLGYLVASSSRRTKVLRNAIWTAFRFLLNRPNSHLLFQNPDDQNQMTKQLKIPSERTSLIRGSGVDVELLQPCLEPAGTPVVLLASRMLRMKGIEEFVEAAKLLRGKGTNARFVLAGGTDPDSFSCVPPQTLMDWQDSGAIEWWGHQQDLRHAFAQATVVCLPSHGGEGVPKVLLEAAALGAPFGQTT